MSLDPSVMGSKMGTMSLLSYSNSPLPPPATISNSVISDLTCRLFFSMWICSGQIIVSTEFINGPRSSKTDFSPVEKNHSPFGWECNKLMVPKARVKTHCCWAEGLQLVGAGTRQSI